MSAAEERLGNDPTSELWGEHRARYRFASRFVAGQQHILDVASGAGFGLQMLRQSGAAVTGLDYDAEALRNVRQLHPSVPLVRGDATRLPLQDASVDLVVSFETLEHVSDAGAMVRELRRVLKPGGRLVLSTPNKAFGPPALHTNNPFHVQEFTGPELRNLLCCSFDSVELYGQRPSPVHRYVPFLLVERHLEPRAIAWKLMTRLPFGLKNFLALAVSGRPFYPDETDYRFEPDGWPGAHALIAVAQ
ncbi:MAG TPA: class I SAM-dependent methyltransferase [Chloroflexota bacterium]|nr:class I SAM-dependent methyltransferase [Chloroflexota bacterium]